MKNSLAILALLFVCFTASAQKDEIKVLDTWLKDTVYWKNEGNFAVNFNQSSFSSNWKGGGVNSYALGSIVNGKLNYFNRRFNWETIGNAQYGLLKAQGQSMRKTIDVLLIDTRAAHALNAKWSTYIGANIISQFDNGYEYGKDSLNNETKKLISRFFAPGYVTLPLGLQYKPSDAFFVRFGIFSVRRTYVIDTTIYHNVPTNYGVPVGKIYNDQIGMQLVAGYDKDLDSTIHLSSHYFGFFDYGAVGADDFVHRFDIMLSAKVTKYISTSLSFLLVYDKNQDRDVQIAQALNLGFLMQLGKK